MSSFLETNMKKVQESLAVSRRRVILNALRTWTHDSPSLSASLVSCLPSIIWLPYPNQVVRGHRASTPFLWHGRRQRVLAEPDPPSQRGPYVSIALVNELSARLAAPSPAGRTLLWIP